MHAKTALAGVPSSGMLELLTRMMGHHDGRHPTFRGGQLVQDFDGSQSIIIDSTAGICKDCGVCNQISE